jgi:hypothetical protein
MSRDSQTKTSKKESVNSKRKDKLTKGKKLYQESSDDDDASFYTDDDSENELDVIEYRKFLKNMFPSKHLDKKIKSGERLKNSLKDDEEEEGGIKSKKNIKKNKQTNKKIESSEESEDEESEEEESEEEESEEEESEEEESEEEESEEEEMSKKHKYSRRKKHIVISEDESEDTETEDDEIDKKGKGKGRKKPDKFNIIFTIGGIKKANNEDEDEDEDEDDEYWSTCSESNTENEDDPISTDEDEKDEKDEEEQSKNKHLSKKHKKTFKELEEKEKNDNELILIDKLKDVLEVKTEKLDVDEDLTSVLKELQSRNKNNILIRECLKVCQDKIKINKEKQEKKVKKEKDRNGRIFKRILRDKNTTNDFEFYDKLETVNQKKIIKELREINKITRIEKPYRLTLLESDIPVVFKAAAMKKISSLRYMEPGSGEYYKIKNWVDTFMRIPFSEYKTLPLSITDGVEKCHDFMANAQKILDEAVYGLNDAKMQIMQMLGQFITNPKAIGSAIAIHGPPGTGKTSLLKEGVSKILNRPFAFIALGGATDSSFLEGHGYTYEGSTWGKIVQILIDSKCMNPVIYFDELDKISDTPKGEEIAGILTHLTDTSQNSQFHDKYFSEIDFDLSKCLFIFSYNDESKINPILKDRMYRIQTKGYNQKQKITISNNYLLPKIREQVMFKIEDIIIPDITLNYIIENHCNKEDGVRNLKRCLEIIYTKLNLYRLMRPDSNLFEEEMSLKVSFPLTVTKDIIDKLIKKSDSINPPLYHMYI